MPLIKSKSERAFKSNLKAELGAGKKKDQALAIAYDVKRKAKRAAGGQAPWFVRNESRGMMHTGPITGLTPGRTDVKNISVPAGSYIVPSDAISHLGQSNTAAGMAKLTSMFGHNGPYGSGSSMAIKSGGLPKAPKLASGGKTDKGNSGGPVPIVAAAGEFSIPPEIVRNIGKGDIAHGHKILDHWILSLRKDHVKTLKRLPPPAKS